MTARIMLLLTAVLLGGCTNRPVAQAEAHVGVATGEVRFEFPRNQVLLPVMIRGEGPFYFILDTGVNPSAVDLGMAQENGLSLDTTQAGTAGGAGTGSVTVFPATVSGLRFGGTRIEDFRAVALDLSALSERLGWPLHGILGYSFLVDRVVQIDYPARVVRLLPDSLAPTTSIGAEEVMRVPLTFRPNDVIPLVEILVNGRSLPVSLDTGSSLSLEIFASAIERLGLQEAYQLASVIELAGARGAFEAREGPVDSVAIGPWVFRNQQVAFSQRSPGAEEGRLGNLGNGLLQHFVLTLDYRHGLLLIHKPQP